MQTPRIQIIVLNYRTPALTIMATEAALREMQGLHAELMIVDNASGDDSMDVMAGAIAARGWAEGGRVTLRQSGHNGGFGAGNNFAMRAGLSDGTMPDFHYILNSDAWPEPGAIRALLDVMIAHPDCGIAGSRIHGEDGAQHQSAFRYPSIAGEFEGAVRTGIFTRLLRKSVVPIPMPTTLAPVDWVTGASLLVRRRMLDEIGLFDEAFFLYYEETDLCRRASRAGWSILYVPASDVVHVGSVSTGMKTWERTPSYWFESRIYYFTKNHGRAYAFGATVARIAGEALWRLRCAISRRPVGDQPRFLRDLTLHAMRLLFRRPPHADTGRAPAIEDVKQ